MRMIILSTLAMLAIGQATGSNNGNTNDDDVRPYTPTKSIKNDFYLEDDGDEHDGNNAIDKTPKNTDTEKSNSIGASQPKQETNKKE